MTRTHSIEARTVVAFAHSKERLEEILVKFDRDHDRDAYNKAVFIEIRAERMLWAETKRRVSLTGERYKHLLAFTFEEDPSWVWWCWEGKITIDF